MKICRKGLHQFEGKRCIECVSIRQKKHRSTPEYREKTRDTKRAIYASNPQIRAKHAEYQRKPEARAKKVERQRARKYGLAIGERDAMLAAQGHTCANEGCRSSEPGNKYGWWHIDHCHLTGKVRGILCHHCNVSLGAAKDCKRRLLGLVRYLDTYSTISEEPGQ